MKREFKSKLSGNEGYYTACSLLVISKNLRGKLERKKILFHRAKQPPRSIDQMPSPGRAPSVSGLRAEG